MLASVAVACAGDPAPELPPLPPKIEGADAGPAGEVRPLRELAIALTGEVRGEIEPCGCPTLPYGGMARRARLVEELRARGVPVFSLDAGQMLAKGGAPAADAGERASAVIAMARAAGLDAWAAGPLDLGVLGFQGLRAEGALSATWKGLAPATVIERDGVRLGVVGLSAPAEGVEVADAVEAVAAAVRGDADAWVVLSNAPEDTARAVAAGVRRVGAVLSVRGTSHDLPVRTAGAPVVETPDRGRYVTLLHVSLGSDPGPWEIAEGGVWKGLATERGILARLDEAAAREARAKDVAALRGEVERATAGRNVAVIEERPLGSDLDGASPVDPLLARFKRSVEGAAAARVEEAPAVGWQTAAGCVKCHADYFAAWSFSPHARAHEALNLRGKGLDPECVACHSTAWGEPGGFSTTDPTAIHTWKSVQCEACHGPLRGHPERESVKPAPVGEATCRRCHDAANSPQFDYATYLRKVSCLSVGK